MQGKIFEGDYKTRCKNIDSLLCVGDTFDMLKREIRLGDRHAVFYMIDGFLKGEVLEKIMEFFLSLAPEDVPETYEDFLKKQKKSLLSPGRCPDGRLFKKLYSMWLIPLPSVV